MTRTIIRLLILLFIAFGAFAIYHFIFDDGTIRVTITQEMIDDALEKKFPKQDTYAKILHVNYENPIVEFLPEKERVSISLDVRTEVGLKSVLSTSNTGSATMTTSLAYNPVSSSFSLVAPSLDELDLPGLSEANLETLKDGMNLAAVLWFDDIPVYRIKDKDLKTRVARHTLQEVQIKNNRIIAVLGLPKEK